MLSRYGKYTQLYNEISEYMNRFDTVESKKLKRIHDLLHRVVLKNELWKYYTYDECEYIALPNQYDESSMPQYEEIRMNFFIILMTYLKSVSILITLLITWKFILTLIIKMKRELNYIIIIYLKSMMTFAIP